MKPPPPPRPVNPGDIVDILWSPTGPVLKRARFERWGRTGGTAIVRVQRVRPTGEYIADLYGSERTVEARHVLTHADGAHVLRADPELITPIVTAGRGGNRGRR